MLESCKLKQNVSMSVCLRDSEQCRRGYDATRPLSRCYLRSYLVKNTAGAQKSLTRRTRTIFCFEKF